MVLRAHSRAHRKVFALVAIASSAMFVAPTVAADDALKPTGYMIHKSPTGLSYTALHDMAVTPSSKAALGVRDADVTKRLLLTFPTGASCATFRSFLTAGFARNGLQSRADQSRVQTLGQACTRTAIQPRQRAVIYYDAKTKVTRLWIEGMATVSLEGVDAMRAVWSLWFATPEDAKDRDGLMSRL